MIAFYAPLKPPTHPTPSGDREIARNLLALLPDARLVSMLRLYDGAGDPAAQTRMAAQAEAEAARILTEGQRPRLWLTYHSYYKAPDLIGPVVAKALNIPYVLIEATRARKRLTGPWARFAQAAEAAADAADLILFFTDHDREALERDRPPGQQLCRLRPFLPRTDLPPINAGGASAVLLSVAMMRAGDKLASYRLMAEALAQVSAPEWHLQIAGDGPARAEVEAAFAPLKDRVTFLGALDRAALEQAYGRARALLWPGVGEAFGMTYLEAQAHGLPVIAQDRPGVRDVLAPGRYPAPEDGPAALARTIEHTLATLSDPAAIQAHIARHHLAPAAQATLTAALQRLAP